MRITAMQLRQIIKEELNRSLYEGEGEETGLGVAKLPADQLIKRVKDPIVEKVLDAVRDDLMIVYYDQQAGRRTKMKGLKFKLDPAQLGDDLYVTTALNEGGTYNAIKTYTQLVMFQEGIFKSATDDISKLGFDLMPLFSSVAMAVGDIISSAAGGASGAGQPLKVTLDALKTKIDAMTAAREGGLNESRRRRAILR